MKKEEKGVSINSEIAAIFWEMADILEMKGVAWKPQAYRAAAQTLESLYVPVENIYRRGGQKEIEALPAVGKGIAEKIIQYIRGRKISEFEKLKKSIPAGLYEMMQVPGIGAKRASLFYHKLKIKDVDELGRAAEEHRLAGLPGFKERAESKILEGIEEMMAQKGRIAYKKARKIADSIEKYLKKIPEVQRFLTVGSVRRKKQTIGDIDIVVQTNQPQKVAEKYVRLPFVKKIMAVGSKKATVITKSGIQADIRLAKPEEWGACVVYFTGDKQHNIWQRRIAIKRGWKLNEYGIFDKRTGKKLDDGTEEGIYRLLGIKMPAPEKRIGETKL